MTAIPESIEDQLDADWTAAGGAEPAYYIHKDWRTTPPLGKDAVWILSYTLKSDTVPVNDDFANENHTIDLIVNTATSEDRLKELADEVVRILNATALTGMTYQRVKKREVVTSQKTFNFQEKLTFDLREQMKSSAAAYGAGTTGDFAVVGDLTVGGDADITGDIIARDDVSINDALTVGGTAAITGVTTFVDETLTSTQISDLLMYGSANAAWVPCALEGVGPKAAGEMSVFGEAENVDNTTMYITYICPLPTNKGSLKLYVSGTRISLADADDGDYITTTNVEGLTTVSRTNLDQDTTDKKTVALHSDTFTAVDCSVYYAVRVRLQSVCTNAGDLNINWVAVQVYYA